MGQLTQCFCLFLAPIINGPEHGLSGEYSMLLEENIYSTIVGWITLKMSKLTHGVIEVKSILTDFLTGWSVKYWKRSIRASVCNSAFFYFSLHFCQFCLMYFDALLLDPYTLRLVDTFSFCNVPLHYFLVIASVLSEINTVTAAFSCL